MWARDCFYLGLPDIGHSGIDNLLRVMPKKAC